MRKILSLLMVLLFSVAAFAATYTVAGSSDVLGTLWNPEDTNNDMQQVSGTMYYYLEKSFTASASDFALAFKVCKDHAWTTSYPGEDYSWTVPKGLSKVLFTFDENSKNVSVCGYRTVAGTPEELFGVEWTPSAAANDMTFADGVYTWENKNVLLSAGTVKFKVTADHAWTNAWPSQDYELTIPSEAKYNVTITYNPFTNAVSAKAEKAGEPAIPAKFYVTGDSALVVDAGLTKDKTWSPSAIKSETDTLVLSLKANVDYQLSLTVDGYWSTKKTYDDLTEKAEGLNDEDGDNHNIGFKLNTASDVQVIYGKDKDNKQVFKLVGDFYVPDPKAEIIGLNDDWDHSMAFTLAQDKKSASITKTFEKGTHEFKMIINDEWRSNGWWLKRDLVGVANITGNADNNMALVVDVKGEYTLTWTFANDSLGVDFPIMPKDTVYFINAFGWEKPHIHMWIPDVTGTVWPGVEMTQVKDNEDKPVQVNGFDVYMMVIDQEQYTKCLFNDGKKEGTIQTADQDWKSKKYFYVDAWYDLSDVPALPDPTAVYSVGGSSQSLFINIWQPRHYWGYNDLDPKEGEDYIYEWESDPVALLAGDIAFKVFMNGGQEKDQYDAAWPAGDVNDTITVTIPSVYVVTITFNALTKEITTKLDRKVDFVLHSFNLMGFNDDWTTGKEFQWDGDQPISLTRVKLTASETPYKFKLKEGGEWYGNGQQFYRALPAHYDVMNANDADMELYADVDGEYIFVFDFNLHRLKVFFPEKVPARKIDALDGAFTINASGDKINFSRGNLRYNVKEGAWYTAPKQYEILAYSNLRFGDTDYTGSIDMFGWSTAKSNFGLKPSANADDFTGDFVDWGTKFDEAEGWRTLTSSEWGYMMYNRGDKAWTIAAISADTIVGLVIFPDNWTAPAGVTIKHYGYFDVEDRATLKENTFSIEEWEKMEAAGAVFWPFAGYRSGFVGNVGSQTNPLTGFNCWEHNINLYAFYWFKNTNNTVPYFSFIPGYTPTAYATPSTATRDRRYGHPVRLVAPAIDPAKYYITGNEALTGEGMAWDTRAIKATTDTTILSLEPGDYQMKILVGGEWLGYDNLKGEEISKGISRGENENDGNIVFSLKKAADIMVVYKSADLFVVKGKFKMPCEDGPYGVYIVGKDRQDTIPAVALTGDDEFDDADRKQYIAYVRLNKGDSISIMNRSCEEIFLPAIEEYGVGKHFTSGLNFAAIDTTGCFNLYIKLKQDDNTLFIGEGICPEDTARFYIAGDGDGLGWAENERIAVKDADSYDLDLKAGDYKLKVVLGIGAGNETWLGFDTLSVKTPGLSADDDRNICFTLKQDGKVTVTCFEAEGKLTFTLAGNFKLPCTDDFGVLVIGENRQDTIPAVALTGDDEFDGDERKQYLAHVRLNAGDSICMIHLGCNDLFLPEIENGDAGARFKAGVNFAKIDTTCCVNLYFKQKYEDDKIYVGYGICPEDTARFYIAGEGSNDQNWWAEDKLIQVKENSYDLDLEAGKYRIKIFIGGDYGDGTYWRGYSNLSTKTDGLSTDGDDNIRFILKEAGKVTVTYFVTKNDQNEDVVTFTVTGNFHQTAEETLRLVPGEYWNYDGAKFAIYTWGDEVFSDWSAFFAGDGDTLSTKINAAADSMVLIRFNSAVEAPTWDNEDVNIWGKIDKIEIDHQSLVYTLTSYETGTWEVVVPEIPAKFYVSGDSALVVDAGLDKAMTWKADAIKSETDTLILTLKADQEYQLKLIENGDWNGGKVYGYDALSEKANGLTRGEGENADNIIFKLNTAGDVQVIYFWEEKAADEWVMTFKLVGDFFVPEPPTPVEAGFYLVGSFNDWTASAEYKLAENINAEGEYQLLGVRLHENDELKVKEVKEDQTDVWYPGEGGNYVVSAELAGLLNIYFRPNYDGGDDWFYNCIYVQKNGGLSIDNMNIDDTKAAKILNNGVIYILRDGKIYNAQGLLVK